MESSFIWGVMMACLVVVVLYTGFVVLLCMNLNKTNARVIHELTTVASVSLAMKASIDSKQPMVGAAILQQAARLQHPTPLTPPVDIPKPGTTGITLRQGVITE